MAGRGGDAAETPRGDVDTFSEVLRTEMMRRGVVKILVFLHAPKQVSHGGEFMVSVLPWSCVTAAAFFDQWYQGM